METKIAAQTPETMIVEWSGPTGHGRLSIYYNGKGGFDVDAEYIGMDTLLSILASVNEQKIQKAKTK